MTFAPKRGRRLPRGRNKHFGNANHPCFTHYLELAPGEGALFHSLCRFDLDS